MHLPRFEYRSPETKDEAIAILSEVKENAKIIAGGTDILPAMKQGRITPKCLVNIKGIKGLAYIKNGKEEISIGALTTLNSIEESSLIQEKFPMLAKAAEDVGAPQHRNAGTLGGNICLNTRCWYYNQSHFFRQCRPVCYKFGVEDDTCQLFPTRKGKGNICYSVYSGDTASSLIALGAKIKIAGPEGERALPLMDLYTGDGKNHIALAPGEILTEVIIPNPPPYSSGIYLKYRAREAIDFPLVGVAVNIALTAKDGVCEKARIVIGAIASKPVQLPSAEAILKDKKITGDLIEEISEAAFKEAKPLPNLLGCSPQYRKKLVKIFTKKAINSALTEIQSKP